MNYERDEDPTREYDMIWTLFQGKEEEEVPKRNKEGVTVKILNFLFGSGSSRDPTEEPLDDYREKRRFHRHVYQPSPRHAAHPGGISANLESAGDSAWSQRRLESADFGPGPASSYPDYQSHYLTLSRVILATTLASMLILVSSASTCLEVIKSLIPKERNLDNGVKK